jgi:hypothetical protein
MLETTRFEVMLSSLKFSNTKDRLLFLAILLSGKVVKEIKNTFNFFNIFSASSVSVVSPVLEITKIFLFS